MKTPRRIPYPDPPVARLIPNPKLRFLDQCREVLRFKQMAYRTEQSYLDWIRRFIVWSGKRHPRDMGAAEVRGFLTHLAADRNVAAATQNQALNALVFLYREVIGGELGWLDGFEPARRGQRLPEVLSREETQAVLRQVTGTQGLIARRLHRTGLRWIKGQHPREGGRNSRYPGRQPPRRNSDSRWRSEPGPAQRRPRDGSLTGRLFCCPKQFTPAEERRPSLFEVPLRVSAPLRESARATPRNSRGVVRSATPRTGNRKR